MANAILLGKDSMVHLSSCSDGSLNFPGEILCTRTANSTTNLNSQCAGTIVNRGLLQKFSTSSRRTLQSIQQLKTKGIQKLFIPLIDYSIIDGEDVRHVHFISLDQLKTLLQ